MNYKQFEYTACFSSIIYMHIWLSIFWLTNRQKPDCLIAGNEKMATKVKKDAARGIILIWNGKFQIYEC
jgi:hypothetical protein